VVQLSPVDTFSPEGMAAGLEKIFYKMFFGRFFCVSYRTVYRYDYSEAYPYKEQPPLCQVTADGVGMVDNKKENIQGV
jgi:hypothetical protein